MTNATVVLRAADGTELAGYRREAVGGARAHLLLVHGLAEHGGRYGHVADRFAEAGVTFHAFDLRGFGRSSGPRAYVERWAEYHDDLELLIGHLRAESAGVRSSCTVTRSAGSSRSATCFRRSATPSPTRSCCPPPRSERSSRCGSVRWHA